MNLATLPRVNFSGGELPEQVPEKAQILTSREVKPQKHYRFCRKRRGAAAVEFALVAPLFFLLVFGMLEFGRMVMVQQILTNASREGARKAVLDGATLKDVTDTVTGYMNDANIAITLDKITFTKNNVPSTDPTGGNSTYGDSIGVQVSVPFSQVSWLPASILLDFLPAGQTDITLTAKTVMRRETVQQ
jgi:hypothetical protein